MQLGFGRWSPLRQIHHLDLFKRRSTPSLLCWARLTSSDLTRCISRCSLRLLRYLMRIGCRSTEHEFSGDSRRQRTLLCLAVTCVVPTIISTTIYPSIVFTVREMTTFSQPRRRTIIALFPRLLYYIQVGEDIGTVNSGDKCVRRSRYGCCHLGIDRGCHLLRLFFGGTGR